MKRITLLVAALMAFVTVSAGAQGQHSLRVAEGVQAKIEAMKKKEASPNANAKAERVELSEVELESYILFLLREKIPAQLNSVDMQLGEGTIASDTQLTLGPRTTGNFIVDRIIRGTHKLFVKGKFGGNRGRGRFDLESVRVDRIPVPTILVSLVFNRFVKPLYPVAQVNAPFDLPWGIDSLTMVPGKALVVY